MTNYLAYPSYDTALVDLDTLTPQPASKGVRYTRSTTAADGSLNQEGPYTILEWNILQDETEYQSVLDQLGVLNSTTSPVTIYCRSDVHTFTRYNGLAVRPEMAKDADYQYFPRNVNILVRNLEQLVEP